MSAWGDAHQRSRFSMFFDWTQYQLKLYAFVRKGYSSFSNQPFIILGDLRTPGLVARFKAYLKALFILFGAFRKNELYYIFGLDILILFFLISLVRMQRPKVIYEVPDIQKFQYKNKLVSKLIQWLERRALRIVDLMIVTSPEFITGYYDQFIRCILPEVQVLENKVHLNLEKKQPSYQDTSIQGVETLDLTHAEKDQITIGYFGLLRCSTTLDLLLQLAQESDRFKIVIRGFFLAHTAHYAAKIEQANHNIIYLGRYASPDDLPLIYSEIDVSWIAYPYSQESVGNWKWARTNRYYEAGFFQKPMIALQGTPDGQNVSHYNLGISVDLSQTRNTLDRIQQELTAGQIKIWTKNIDKLPSETFSVGEEYDELFDKIAQLTSNI
jgi:succinoglycan biosynthesis protein ExoL